VPLVRLEILRVRALRAATAAIGINAIAFTAVVSADEKGLASGIFESVNHLFGGAVGVALYATLVAASGYAAAFLAAAVLAGLAAVGAVRAG
jgi:pyrroline-5-carboxylate reductase